MTNHRLRHQYRHRNRLTLPDIALSSLIIFLSQSWINRSANRQSSLRLLRLIVQPRFTYRYCFILPLELFILMIVTFCLSFFNFCSLRSWVLALVLGKVL